MADTGKTDELKGRIKEAYGDLADDKKTKTQGVIDKAVGKIKQGIDEAKEKLHDVIDKHEEKKDA